MALSGSASLAFLKLSSISPVFHSQNLFSLTVAINVSCRKENSCFLQPYSYRAFLAGVVPGRGVFHLHPVTPLSFNSDDSNFVQNYFGVGLMFWGKKNRDQIDNDVTMMSSLL